MLGVAGAARAAPPPLPTNGHVVSGNIAITAQGRQLTITQSTARGIIDWNAFSIGAGATAQFNNGSGATLNRVTGGAAATIAGTLRGTGSVYVTDPQGVVIGPGGKVLTGGSFIASTRPMDAAGFLAGNAPSLSGGGAGGVVNQGSIVSSSGDVVLVGSTVSNSGRIAAPNGTAALAAGDQMVLSPAGGDPRVAISGGAGSVTQAGRIRAAQIELNAAGGNVYALAGNRGAETRATGTATVNGHVWLTAGGAVDVAAPVAATQAGGAVPGAAGGTIPSAAGGAVPGAAGGAITVTAGGTATIASRLSVRGRGSAAGGTISIAGARVTLTRHALLDARGGGAGGRVTIGGSSGSPGAAQSVTVQPGARIAIDGGSAGGSATIWSATSTDFAGRITGTGGSGDGGAVEISSAGRLVVTGTVDLSSTGGQTGSLMLDPGALDIICDGCSTSDGASTITASTLSDLLATASVTLSTGTASGDITVLAPVAWSSANGLTLTAAQNIVVDAMISNTGIGGVTLRADLSQSGSGTVVFGPQGGVDVAQYLGIFYRPTDYAHPTDYLPFVHAGTLDIDMLVETEADLKAISTNLAGDYIIGNPIDAAGLTGFTPIGSPAAPFTGRLEGRGSVISGLTINDPGGTGVGLFGAIGAGGAVTDLYLSGLIVSGGSAVGGIAGVNAGTIDNAFVSGNVAGSGNQVGGLVGENLTTGSIGQALATAHVSGGGEVGGLVGGNAGSIADAMATGEVDGGAATGGLVGDNSGTIAAALSTGAVSGGGLVGVGTGRVSDGYWDTDTSGQGGSAAGIGLSTAQLQAALPAGLSGSLWTLAATGLPSLLDVGPKTPPPADQITAVDYADRGVAAFGGAEVAVTVDGISLGDFTTRDGGYFTFQLPAALASAASLDVLETSGGAYGGTTLFSGTLFGPMPAAESLLDIYGDTLRLTGSAPSLSAFATALSVALGSTGSGTRQVTLAPGDLLSLSAGTGLEIDPTGNFVVDQPVSTGTASLVIDGAGQVTQSAPVSTAQLALLGGGGFTLTDPGNAIGTVAAQAGSLSLVDGASLTVGSVIGVAGVSATGPVSLASAGDLTLDQPVVSAASGDAVVLAARGMLANQAGPSGVQAASGRFLLFAADPADLLTGGLAGSASYGEAFDLATDSYAPVADAGNRFVYAAAAPPAPPTPPIGTVTTPVTTVAFVVTPPPSPPSAPPSLVAVLPIFTLPPNTALLQTVVFPLQVQTDLPQSLQPPEDPADAFPVMTDIAPLASPPDGSDTPPTAPGPAAPAPAQLALAAPPTESAPPAPAPAVPPAAPPGPEPPQTANTPPANTPPANTPPASAAPDSAAPDGAPSAGAPPDTGPPIANAPPPDLGTGPVAADAAGGAAAGDIGPITQAAQQAADAAAAASNGAFTSADALAAFNEQVNAMLAAGLSPDAAVAAAQQAMGQLLAADVRDGPATPAEQLGDALASGGSLASLVADPDGSCGQALSTALAAGQAPPQAMRTMQQACAAAAAQLAAAAVPIGPQGAALAALSTGDPAAAIPSGLPPDQAAAYGDALAAALAQGLSGAQALAAAQTAAATEAQMAVAATLPPTAASTQAATLATGGRLPDGAAGAALAAALDAGASMDAALRQADAAGRQATLQLAAATVTPDPVAATLQRLAAGQPPQPEDCITLAAILPAGACGAAGAPAQLAAARLPDTPAIDQATALATGRAALPDAEAAARATAGAAQLAAATLPPPADGGPDGLLAQLAAGTASAADLLRLAPDVQPAAFTRDWVNALNHGLGIGAALQQARDTIAGLLRDLADATLRHDGRADDGRR